MHAVILTLLVLGGADENIISSNTSSYSATARAETGCDQCGGNCGHRNRRGQRPGFRTGSWMGSMPQTCYNPNYGCYSGNGRHTNRYPAFHGTYYRRPYNYRNTFDYPWHARLHEPTSLFSYNAGVDESEGAPALSSRTLLEAHRLQKPRGKKIAR